VQKRMQRKEEERKAAIAANGSMSTRTPRTEAFGGTTKGAYTPKGSWLSGRLTGRRTARGMPSSFGYLSSRSARSQANNQDTNRSMMSTSRSMMTTARSDVATGRYNEVGEITEITETRTIDMSKMMDVLPDDGNHRRRDGARARTGKTPRKSTSMSAAASLRAGLLRRGVQLRGRGTGRTPRTSRMGVHSHPPRQPGERPAFG
jgi:hypothetical protein